MKKILLIEDDQVFANVYRKRLALGGFSVEVACDGETGLETLRDYRPDAVLVDLILPNLQGVDVIKQIRLEPAFQRLPLIVFTNTYLTSTVQEAWKAGATRCLSKATCTPQSVIGTIRDILDGTASSGEPVEPAAEPAAPAPLSKPLQTQPVDKRTDDEFLAELRQTFVEGLPATLAALRTLLQGLIKAETEMARRQQILHLYRRTRALTSNASIAAMFQITQMTDALEALLKELHEKPKNINASTLRTVASAIDFLGLLFQHTSTAPDKQFFEANVLVVDDEAISRRAITYSLEKAKLRSTSLEDPLQVEQTLAGTKFDLIFLDVDMPNMNGYELCGRLRNLPAYKKTPVVFVTSLNDLESRANSSMSGGNDFIAKPFLFIEMAVKALVYVLRARLETQKD